MYSLPFFMYFSTLAVAQYISNPPLLCSHITSPEYDALAANRSGTFHINYSAGNVTPNGLMASESIYWTDNNADLLGRSNFVARLKLFMPIVPGLAIHDHIRINDGDKAAILYTFQGIASGSFLGAPPTNARIMVQGAELMAFDDNALLNRLITVEEVDIFEMQLTRAIIVPAFDSIPKIVTMPTTSAKYVCQNKQNVATLTHFFNSNQIPKMSTLVNPSIVLNLDNRTATHGPDVFVSHWNSLKASFPDLLQHDEYIVGEGIYTAVTSIMEGTFTGKPFTASNGTMVQPDGQFKKVRYTRFFEHGPRGLITQMWEVHNNNDFLTQTITM